MGEGLPDPGILDEVDMATNRVEAGLLLGQSILINSLLYSAEAGAM